MVEVEQMVTATPIGIRVDLEVNIWEMFRTVWIYQILISFLAAAVGVEAAVLCIICGDCIKTNGG